MAAPAGRPARPVEDAGGAPAGPAGPSGPTPRVSNVSHAKQGSPRGDFTAARPLRRAVSSNGPCCQQVLVPTKRLQDEMGLSDTEMESLAVRVMRQPTPGAHSFVQELPRRRIPFPEALLGAQGPDAPGRSGDGEDVQQALRGSLPSFGAAEALHSAEAAGGQKPGRSGHQRHQSQPCKLNGGGERPDFFGPQLLSSASRPGLEAGALGVGVGGSASASACENVNGNANALTPANAKTEPAGSRTQAVAGAARQGDSSYVILNLVLRPDRLFALRQYSCGTISSCTNSTDLNASAAGDAADGRSCSDEMIWTDLVDDDDLAPKPPRSPRHRGAMQRQNGGQKSSQRSSRYKTSAGEGVAPRPSPGSEGASDSSAGELLGSGAGAKHQGFPPNGRGGDASSVAAAAADAGALAPGSKLRPEARAQETGWGAEDTSDLEESSPRAHEKQALEQTAAGDREPEAISPGLAGKDKGQGPAGGRNRMRLSHLELDLPSPSPAVSRSPSPEAQAVELAAPAKKPAGQAKRRGSIVAALTPLSYPQRGAFPSGEPGGAQASSDHAGSGIYQRMPSEATIDDLVSSITDFDAGGGVGSFALNRMDGIEVLSDNSDSSDDSEDSEGLVEVLQDLTALGLAPASGLW